MFKFVRNKIRNKIIKTTDNHQNTKLFTKEKLWTLVIYWKIKLNLHGIPKRDLKILW